MKRRIREGAEGRVREEGYRGVSGEGVCRRVREGVRRGVSGEDVGGRVQRRVMGGRGRACVLLDLHHYHITLVSYFLFYLGYRGKLKY